MITKQTYAELLQEGVSLEIGRLSISPIKRMNKISYQVHSDDYRNPFSRIYADIFDAVNDFLEAKQKLSRS